MTYYSLKCHDHTLHSTSIEIHQGRFLTWFGNTSTLLTSFGNKPWATTYHDHFPWKLGLFLSEDRIYLTPTGFRSMDGYLTRWPEHRVQSGPPSLADLGTLQHLYLWDNTARCTPLLCSVNTSITSSSTNSRLLLIISIPYCWCRLDQLRRGVSQGKRPN